jgi:hypothetical protein
LQDAGRSKKPAGVWRRRAIVTSAIDSGLLAQAIAVRRHDRRTMVVMTMMEVELHLRDNPKQDGLVCQMRRCKFICGFPRVNAGFSMKHSAELRDALPLRTGSTGSYAGSCIRDGRGWRTEAG